MLELQKLFDFSIVTGLRANARGDRATAEKAFKLASETSSVIAGQSLTDDRIKNALLQNARGDHAGAQKILQQITDHSIIS